MLFCFDVLEATLSGLSSLERTKPKNVRVFLANEINQALSGKYTFFFLSQFFFSFSPPMYFCNGIKYLPELIHLCNSNKSCLLISIVLRFMLSCSFLSRIIQILMVNSVLYKRSRKMIAVGTNAILKNNKNFAT